MDIIDNLLIPLIQTMITTILIIFPILGALFYGTWGLVIGFIPVFSLAFYGLYLKRQLSGKEKS